MDIKVFREIERRGHEQVCFFHFPEVGLKAIIGVHNAVLGPALGGCRMRLYEDETQAIDDVLRLSEGMTYKSSLAGLDLGGGKSVIIADPTMERGRRELFLKFAECLNHMAGRYITAEDMGTSVSDVKIMREVTKYAAGFAREEGGSGDPSPFTARGVFRGIMAACERKFGSADLTGRKVAVQGVGHVGYFLVERLKEAGAKVTACDVREENIRKTRAEFGVEVVPPDAIYDVECDVFSPNAIGQTVNPDTIKRIKASIIAGGANNQLLDSSLYKTILDRKILYCPDFVINAGGVISVGAEYNQGGWKESWVVPKVDNIYNTVHTVLDESEKRDRFPEVVAIELAKERIDDARRKKGSR